VSDFRSLPTIKEVIKEHNLRAEKKLGQNFLLDLNITDKIVRNAPDIKDSVVFEIGPGPGSLTRSILKSEPKKLVAIEYDTRAINALSGLVEFSKGKLELHHADALKTDLTKLSGDKLNHIIANLPYNIATPLTIKWLEQIKDKPDYLASMVLMFQKEVANRITAKPNTKLYGRLSVLSQWLCDVNLCFYLPPSAFIPPPKVDSAIVCFKPKTLPEDSPSFKTMEILVGKAFNQRRKMIRTTLKEYSEHIETLGIDKTLRAENLEVQDFVEIAKSIEY
jgi:16S rRNA (adenine1518-N6/adenine1519-N6)-dimethyltransferase